MKWTIPARKRRWKHHCIIRLSMDGKRGIERTSAVGAVGPRAIGATGSGRTACPVSASAVGRTGLTGEFKNFCKIRCLDGHDRRHIEFVEKSFGVMRWHLQKFFNSVFTAAFPIYRSWILNLEIHLPCIWEGDFRFMICVRQWPKSAESPAKFNGPDVEPTIRPRSKVFFTFRK